jgi:hypothetical protein
MSGEIEEVPESLQRLIKAVEDCGWSIAMPGVDNEDSEVPGLIIGRDDYIDIITSYLPDNLQSFRKQ